MQTPGDRSLRRHSAFTLVELLAVLGIVAILAAILIPVTAKSRAASSNARCVGNMRQIGAQLLAYASDNRGVTIVAMDTNKNATWQKQLALYDGTYTYLTSTTYGNGADLGIWKCPENEVQNRNISTAGLGEEFCSYGINGWADTSSVQGERYTGARVATITNPSKLCMLAEACYYRFEEWKNTGQGTLPENLYATGPSYLRYAHGGKINLIFADGHAELREGPLPHRGTAVSVTLPLSQRFTNGTLWYSQ